FSRSFTNPIPLAYGVSGSKARARWLLSLSTKRRGIMQTRRMCRVVCAVAVLAWFMSAGGSAQTADERTFFTFSGPFELPGVALPAGTYLFRLADPDGGRGVVQVLSADGKKAYGLFFTRAEDRITRSD